MSALLHDYLAAGRSAERLAWVATLDALEALVNGAFGED